MTATQTVIKSTHCHPEGKVPVLDHDGTLITESPAVVLYLSDLFPAAGLAPVVGNAARGSYLAWLAYSAVETAQASGGNLAHVTGYASKAAEQAARIAGVLTLWRDMGAAEVTAEAMAEGIALAQFYLGEAAPLAEAATFSAPVEQAETLRTWLLERWAYPEVTPREMDKQPLAA